MLAILTGATIDAYQFSMYLYSILVLIATLFLYPHIKRLSPFHNLVLAHLYALDSVINAIYTAIFGYAWFSLLAGHPASSSSAATGIAENAGFTSPTYNVSSVNIVATPADGLKPGQDAVAVGQGTGSLDSAGLGNAVFQSGSIMSISLICGFWAVRVYFVFVMLAFARQCLRQHIATHGSNTSWYNNNNTNTSSTSPNKPDLAENPFEEGKEDGYGWKGKLGRLMLSGAPTYWLGAEEDREWMRGLGGKFRNSVEPVGVNERERRRRSGTGPPAPPRDIQATRLADLPEVR